MRLFAVLLFLLAVLTARVAADGDRTLRGNSETGSNLANEKKTFYRILGESKYYHEKHDLRHLHDCCECTCMKSSKAQRYCDCDCSCDSDSSGGKGKGKGGKGSKGSKGAKGYDEDDSSDDYEECKGDGDDDDDDDDDDQGAPPGDDDDDDDEGGGEAKIGPGIREEVENNGSAQIIISLRSDSSQSIADMQDEVIDNLGDEFIPTVLYSSIPALAGTVLSQEGVDILALDENVVMVDLDEPDNIDLEDSVPVINADERQSSGNDGNGVVVAVLDTGIDTDHDNLEDSLVAEACFSAFNDCPGGSSSPIGPGSAEDDGGHGTHVSGIITSNGSNGGVGVAPGSKIVALKVCHSRRCFICDQLSALDFIIRNPQLEVKIINMSFGGGFYEGKCDDANASNRARADAFNTLRDMGVVAFAATGNDRSSTTMGAPACLSNVISVGASNNDDVPASFSNSNQETDVFAPGVDVVSSDLDNSLSSKSGTSMASPHAAGCAALLVEKGDAVTPKEIEDRLKDSDFMVTIPESGLSFPRIDCSPGRKKPDKCEKADKSRKKSKGKGYKAGKGSKSSKRGKSKRGNGSKSGKGNKTSKSS